ncbi:5-deoxy-glucuronate isomerase [Solirubrobacter sp. CPCC 204708]|uniref:5-deoxy-glucuronate isomerase n=1 Tax=Solirubrobacter deserti TaxID=2282478 RepID=A0ABT4RJU2_9ACTN|nr:5-deoxy-glucuronate isomerase [Solirubrobacter deserti]MBE2315852.1 5-deoxy-glucuronate isomerase [Solirubrobacter deserti]MDA0138811.1 5-deoxy-glucuronate isomerase [Solirubrobacter deserti]
MLEYAKLRIVTDADTFNTGGDEVIVLPLAGSCAVTIDGERFELEGRESVFSAVTDFVYAPIGSHVVIDGEGRFALPAAPASRRLPARYGPAEDVPVELRGAGNASRQVNNFASVEAFECDTLIAVEVLTPNGNWSSYPPHRHDDLEEIYYYEVSGGGFAYQRVYDGMELLAEVRSGDRINLPLGYHGPSMAAPGYDLYYLNVMAGPVREWNFVDDPDHAWIRDTWAEQELDPRLPMTKARTK